MSRRKDMPPDNMATISGLIGHLRGEEDAGDEGEQSAELVDEEGDEVEVVLQEDGLHRGVRWR